MGGGQSLNILNNAEQEAWYEYIEDLNVQASYKNPRRGADDGKYYCETDSGNTELPDIMQYKRQKDKNKGDNNKLIDEMKEQMKESKASSEILLAKLTDMA